VRIINYILYFIHLILYRQMMILDKLHYAYFKVYELHMCAKSKLNFLLWKNSCSCICSTECAPRLQRND